MRQKYRPACAFVCKVWVLGAVWWRHLTQTTDPPMSEHRVLITGGAGFIGRWVVDRCLQQGCQVAVYDDFSAGTRDHLADFADAVTVYEADILDQVALDAAFAAVRPDVVIHLAALHFIPYCNTHPEEAMRINGEGTYAVLHAGARHSARRAVVASSGAIYPSVEAPIPEDLAPEPPDVYALSKLTSEHVAAYFARTTGLSCVAARLFNTYGPWETNPHLIPHIMESLHQGPSVQLGNIHTKRDYVYVEDVARFLVALADADLPTGYETVNVGTGVEYSAEDIVRTLGDLLDQEIIIEVDDTRVRTVDKMHQRADTARLERLTGLAAIHDLEAGLMKLLHHEQLLPLGV